MDKFEKFRECYSKLNDLIEEFAIEKTKRKNQEAQSGSHLGEIKFRVLHCRDNPIDRALKRKQSDIEAIRRENDKLSARLSLLEAGNSADVTRRIDDAVNSANQIELLTKKVEALKCREDKILNSFKKTSREFREVCYLLTGYRIDPLKDDVFRLSHMYAEHEEDKLFFEVKRDGTINLLKNEYTDQYTQFMSTYLEEADSFPAFLAAITLDLFKSSSQSVDMSMDMSTTILPNENRYKNISNK